MLIIIIRYDISISALILAATLTHFDFYPGNIMIRILDFNFIVYRQLKAILNAIVPLEVRSVASHHVL